LLHPEEKRQKLGGTGESENHYAVNAAHSDLANYEGAIKTILAEFRVARERQVKLLIGLRPDDFARSAWHPRLKMPMRLVDHLLFIAEHDDHHLARIWELRPGEGQGQCA
jgi:hypothetical protein